MPVMDSEVVILGIDKTQSDKSGNFSLDISNCESCPAKSEVIIQIYSAQESMRYSYILPDDYPSNIESLVIPVPFNNIILDTGIVKNQQNGNFLKGIKVSAKIDGLESKIKTTDMFGYFEFVINTVKIRNLEKMHLLFIDPERKMFKDHEESIIIKNNYCPKLKVFLEPCHNCPKRHIIEINSTVATDIFVKTGDSIIIQEGGKISINTLNIISGPDG